MSGNTAKSLGRPGAASGSKSGAGATGAPDERARFTIADARFVISAASVEQCPPPELPEVAFFGRSNVGKSSLLNALVERKSLAVTGKTPGRTRLINFFEVVFKDRSHESPERQAMHFVDLPGYGYAAVGRDVQRQWQDLIGRYLFGREAFRFGVLLIDGRREIEEEEQWIASTLHDRGHHDDSLFVAITKVDKLNQREVAQCAARVEQRLGINRSRIFLTSTIGDRRGIDRLRYAIASSIFD